MRTADLFGQSIAAYQRMIDRRSYKVEWDVRLIDENGKVWPIPPKAIKFRTRSTALDGGTWSLGLTLYKAMLPAGVNPQAYHRLEIDRCVAGVWPYFRGKIDHVLDQVTEENGAAVQVLDLEAFGVLQQAKNYRINSMRLDPAWTFTSTIPLMGVCTTQRIMRVSAISAGQSEQLPAAIVYGLTETYAFQGLIISPNADMSSPYLQGEVIGYTIDTSTAPATITWGAIATPASTRYFQFNRLECFVAPRNAASPTQYWFRLPYGRDLNDLYHTEVASFNAGTNKITPLDPTGYKAMLDVAQGEYLTTRINGLDTTIKISSVNASTGELTLSSALPAGLAIGTPIRLGTTDYNQAWDDDRDIHFADAYMLGNEYKAPRIVAVPNSGMAIAQANKISDNYWPTASQVWGSNVYAITDRNVITSSGGSGIYPNRAEEAIRVLLCDGYLAGISIGVGGSGYASGTYALGITGGGGTGAAGTYTCSGGAVLSLAITAYGHGYTSAPSITFPSGGGSGAMAGAVVNPAGTSLFQADNVQVQPLGVLIKNYTRSACTLDDVLADFKQNAFPPNSFIHDTQDGRILIQPYTQKESPDWEIRGVRDFRRLDEPEPVTAMTVIGKGDPVTMAPVYFNGSLDLTNPLNALDGDESGTTYASIPTTAGSSGTMTFTIPAPSPLQRYPFIDSIDLCGTGLATVYVTTGGTDYYLRNYVRIPLQGTSAITISGEDLQKIFSTNSAASASLTIKLEHNESGSPQVNGTLSSVRINVSRRSAWRAQLTDDPTLTVVPSDPTQFGTVWLQPDTSKRESYRYAPTSYLKRVLPLYNASGASQKHRHVVKEMQGISQADARDYAEAHEDEYLRAGSRYSVIAPLVDYAEPGDTVRIYHPDGTIYNLFLWGLSDDGDRTSGLATYDFIDYSR